MKQERKRKAKRRKEKGKQTMAHSEWYGLDELGRGTACPLEAEPVESEGRTRVRPHASRWQAAAMDDAAPRGMLPAECGERLSAVEGRIANLAAQLDQLLLAAHSISDGMAAHAAREDERAAVVEEVKGGLDGLSSQFKARISRTDYEEATLKRISDELDQHRDGLYRKIVEPLISEVIDIHQDMSITIAAYRRKAERVGVSESAARVLRDLEEFQLMLGDVLRNWNVEVWQPEPGDALEPLRCRAVRALATNSKEQHRTVAEALSFGYALDGKILRPAQVIAFSYKEPPAQEAAAQEPTEPAKPAEPADPGDTPEPLNGTADAAASVPEATTDAAAGAAEGAAPTATKPSAYPVPPIPPAPPAPEPAKAGGRLPIA